MSRQTITLKDGWRFTRHDDATHAAVECDDRDWKPVRVPHDWAIAGPFDREHDIQRIENQQADVAAGVKEITGRTGGLPHVGVGWYRRIVAIPGDLPGQRIRLEIDGAMSHAQVYCNGVLVGGWPYGYTSFALDLTDHVRPGEDNLIAIRLENPAQASRWYPGAGLYRHVRLVCLHPVHVAHWGTCLTTPEISETTGRVCLATTLENHGPATDMTLQTTIRDAAGTTVATAETSQPVDGSLVVEQVLTVTNPRRWMPGQAELYTVTTEVMVAGGRS